MDDSELTQRLVAAVLPVLRAELQGAAPTLSTADLGGIEHCLQRVLREVGGALVTGLSAVHQAAALQTPPCCVLCGERMRLVDRARPRRLEGLVGPLEVRRAWYHCAACHRGVAPLDGAWRLGPGVLSPAAACAVSRVGLEVSFAQAAAVVADLLGLQVDAETVRSVTEGLGQVAEETQADPTAWMVPQAAVPERLVVALDGVFVHGRDGWREMKVGRLAPLGPALTPVDETGQQHLAWGPSTYTATLGTALACWERVAREARRAGLGRGVQTVVVLGDGAEWIWKPVHCYLGLPGVRVVEIVDFFHAAQHLALVATAVFGPQSPAAAAWLDTTRHALRHEGPQPVLAALAALTPSSEGAADEVRRAVGYVTTHAHRMAYPAFRAQQLPIGSGAIESTAKHLIQLRQTQAGMRWTPTGAQLVATLRAVERSGRWAVFWQAAPQTRLRLVPAGATLDAPDEPRAVAPPDTAPPEAFPPLLDRQTVVPLGRDRIVSDGKVWGKGKKHFGRSIIHRRSA